MVGIQPLLQCFSYHSHQYMHWGQETVLVCYYQTAFSTGISQGHYSLYTGQLPVNCKFHMRPLVPAWALWMGTWPEPCSKWNRASAETSPVDIKSFMWTTHTSCCGCFSHLVNCYSGLNCFHCSRSTALGCLSILFLSSSLLLNEPIFVPVSSRWGLCQLGSPSGLSLY